VKKPSLGNRRASCPENPAPVLEIPMVFLEDDIPRAHIRGEPKKIKLGGKVYI